MEYGYRKAAMEDAEAIYSLVQDTIKTIYPDYYPKEIADFFCRLHSREAIIKDIREGYVRVLEAEGCFVGTGSCMDNHITRVYVSPAYQGRGCGSFIMEKLEHEIAENYGTADLDASLPAVRFYEGRGYRTVRHESSRTDPHAVLVYEVMKKGLCGSTFSICYDGRFFVPKTNSENGEVSGGTVFAYHQEGSLLWAEYAGDEILRGYLIGTADKNGELDFCYQHMNIQGQTRIGKCHSIPRLLENGKLELSETWQWLNGDCSKGTSLLRER